MAPPYIILVYALPEKAGESFTQTGSFDGLGAGNPCMYAEGGALQRSGKSCAPIMRFGAANFERSYPGSFAETKSATSVTHCTSTDFGVMTGRTETIV